MRKVRIDAVALLCFALLVFSLSLSLLLAVWHQGCSSLDAESRWDVLSLSTIIVDLYGGGTTQQT